MAMERIFSGYIKAHGYAIAVTALTFGCIFAVEVAHVDIFHQIMGELFLNQSQHNGHYYETDDGPPSETTTENKRTKPRPSDVDVDTCFRNIGFSVVCFALFSRLVKWRPPAASSW